ncbi:MAG TPA: Rieske 2Fe-2S domain-containing protein [Actinomycetota bacterium]|nr:Rieske 2Fe-2S domain-containing protein [Actinomycetota bacterium]
MNRGDDAASRSLRDRISENALVTRRDYLRLLVTVSGGLLAGTGAVAAGVFRRHGDGSVRPKRIASSIAPGEAVTFDYPGDDDPAIAVRLEDGALVGYSSICTHLACAVLWIKESGRLECPCHDGVFNVRTGGVVAGPPPRPLPAIRLEEREDGIYAVRTENT